MHAVRCGCSYFLCLCKYIFFFIFFLLNKQPVWCQSQKSKFCKCKTSSRFLDLLHFLSVLDLSTACICTTGNLHPTNIDNGVCMRCICRREWIWTHTHPPPMNPDMSLISSHVVCIWGIDVALFFIIHPLLFIVSFVAHWLSEEKRKTSNNIYLHL